MPLAIKSLHPRRRRRRIHLPIKRVPFRGPTRPLLPRLPVRPERSIVLRPLPVIGEYSVSFRNFLEFGRFEVATVVTIGMEGEGYFAVGLFDVVLGGGAGDVEELVQVLFEVGC